MKEALSSTDKAIITRPTRCNIPEDTIVYSHRRENLKSYPITFFTGAKPRSDAGSISTRLLHINCELEESFDGRLDIPLRSQKGYPMAVP
jgi:hypothetical protein